MDAEEGVIRAFVDFVQPCETVNENGNGKAVATKRFSLPKTECLTYCGGA
jgi:hypothetical protein